MPYELRESGRSALVQDDAAVAAEKRFGKILYIRDSDNDADSDEDPDDDLDI